MPKLTKALLGRPGIWRGLESPILGLKGLVISESLERVLKGLAGPSAVRRSPPSSRSW